MRVLILLALASGLGACAGEPVAETMPTSVYQWERRQERIAQEETDRQRQCQAARTDETRRRWCREGDLPQ